MTAKEKMWLANAVINWEDRPFPLVPDPPNPMTKIRFDYGTVTISDGFVQAPSPTLTAFLDTLAATLPGYGWSRSFSMRTSTLHRVSSAR